MAGYDPSPRPMPNQTAPQLLTFMGAPGSPYTRKMRAALRYRRIPYRFLISGAGGRDDLPAAKVRLLPTFYLPNEAGELEAVVDSTPLIRRFEREFEGRSVIPPDLVTAFIDYLLEDFADEWLTKAMFHYRWVYEADIEKAGQIPRGGGRWKVLKRTSSRPRRWSPNGRSRGSGSWGRTRQRVR